jgi:cobalt-zinc-cadmium efflux system membrane fusion protein
MSRWLARGFTLALLLSSVSGCGEKKAGAADSAAAAEQPKDKGPRLVKFDPAALERLGLKSAPAGGTGSESRLRVPGTLEYNLEHYAEVGTIVEGRVAAVMARPGERVKKGQVLATLVVPSIAKAQAEFVSARAAAQVARENAQREASLLEKQLTTAREAEVARSEMVRAEAELNAAAARLRVLGVGDPQNGGVIQGAGGLTLSAPIEGIIVRRDAVLGKFLQPNETAFVVADPNELWATVEIYESDLPFFQPGAEVEITMDAIPGKTIAGKVTLVEPTVGKENRVLRARIAVPNADGALRPGLFIRASIKLSDEATQGKLLVPAGAVQPLGDDDVVFIEREPGKYEIRTVKVGRTTPQFKEITQGLAKGEKIVIDGAFLLRGEATKQ